MVMGPEEFGQLVDRHAAGLVLYARQWCSAPEDIVQDAFLKVMSQKNAPHNVVPWLYRVVRNGALAAVRADKRRRQRETARSMHMPAWFMPTEGAALDGATAAAALQQLPAEEREVITMHLWGGLTFEEIAAVVETSPSSAHRWYAAGLNTLRERLKVHDRSHV
jgi:RNA polymerase sigma factor (sigma-70 family)